MSSWERRDGLHKLIDDDAQHDEADQQVYEVDRRSGRNSS